MNEVTNSKSSLLNISVVIPNFIGNVCNSIFYLNGKKAVLLN